MRKYNNYWFFTMINLNMTESTLFHKKCSYFIFSTSKHNIQTGIIRCNALQDRYLRVHEKILKLPSRLTFVSGTRKHFLLKMSTYVKLIGNTLCTCKTFFNLCYLSFGALCIASSPHPICARRLIPPGWQCKITLTCYI